MFHPTTFRVGLRSYRPDLYLPKESKYIEVVGSRQAFYEIRRKLELAQRIYGVKIEIVRPDGRIYNCMKLPGRGNGLAVDFFPPVKTGTIKELRRFAGLRGYEVAQALGLSPAIYSAYERSNGKAMPKEMKQKALKLFKNPQAVNPMVNPPRILGELKKVVRLKKPV